MCDRQASQRWDNQLRIVAIVFPQTNTPTLIQSRAISSHSDGSSPLILFFFFLVYMCSLFFPVSLFSCHYVVKGQRLWARCLLGQLPQDLHADPYLQMWPFSSGPATKVSKSYSVRWNLPSPIKPVTADSFTTLLFPWTVFRQVYVSAFPCVKLLWSALIKVENTQASHLF